MKLSATQLRVLKALAEPGAIPPIATRYDTLLILREHGFIKESYLGLYFPNITNKGRAYLAGLEGENE